MDQNMEKIGDTLRKRLITKSPAYPWQDFALKIIKELNIPSFKKSAVFKVCKMHEKIFIERCFNDTKELCRSGEKWKYFFKVVAGKENDKPSHED